MGDDDDDINTAIVDTGPCSRHTLSQNSGAYTVRLHWRESPNLGQVSTSNSYMRKTC